MEYVNQQPDLNQEYVDGFIENMNGMPIVKKAFELLNGLPTDFKVSYERSYRGCF
jgi:hypothetical protein